MTVEPDIRPEPHNEMRDDPFLHALTSILRADAVHDALHSHSDARLLANFLIPEEHDGPVSVTDQDLLQRIEHFYRAVGLRIEQCTGRLSSPTVEVSADGFGRVFLTSGTLVVFSRSLHALQRFGFEDLDRLAREGERTVHEAMATIEHDNFVQG
jgi:probable nitrogen fixation protein